MDNATAERIRNMLPMLDERQRRLYLANEAKAIGTAGYHKSVRYLDEELSKVNIQRDDFHSEWNYTISPNL